ncbi:3706_t:CDS:2, partial [Dentiscutata erythropus]
IRKCDDNDNHKEMSLLDFKKYKKTYSEMDNVKSLVHSFILDPYDDTYIKENVFTKTELQEIQNSKQANAINAF